MVELKNQTDMIDISSNDTTYDLNEKSTLCLTIAVSTINLLFVFLTTYLLLRRIIKLRNPLQLYIQNIVFCNFFVAGGHLVGAVRYLVRYNPDAPFYNGIADRLCVFQSIFTTYTNLATFFWMMMIEWSAYRLMLRKPAPLKRGSWFLHLLCWLIPAFIVSFALVNNILGEDLDLSGPGYCWIRHSKDWREHLLWGLLTAKAWEFIAIFATVNFYFYNFCIFKRRSISSTIDILLSNNDETAAEEGNDVSREQSEANHSDLLWECRGLALLPLNLMIVRIWGTTRFWIDISIDVNYNRQRMEYASLILLHFQSIGDSSLAFFNFLLLAIVKWTQITEAYPYLKRFRPCQWLSKRQSLSALEKSHDSIASQRNGEMHGFNTS